MRTTWGTGGRRWDIGTGEREEEEEEEEDDRKREKKREERIGRR